MARNFDPFKETVRNILLERSGGVCWYCGTDLAGTRWIIEHIVPESKGGSYEIDNLAPSCRSCNAIKSNHDIDTFRTLIQNKLHGTPKFTDEQREYLRGMYGIDPYVHEDVAPFWFELSVATTSGGE